MNKENTMVHVGVTLGKEGDFLMIKDFKKVKDVKEYEIHENFINIMTSKNSIINVARVNNENDKNIMTVSGASFDIVKGYEDKLYLEMTQDEWSQFCFITKEPSYIVIRTDIMFLDIENVIKGTGYSALILDNNTPLSNWSNVIGRIFADIGTKLENITDNGEIIADSPVSVYKVILKNGISNVVFYSDKSNCVSFAKDHICKSIMMKTKDIFTKTEWSKLIDSEGEEAREFMPDCKGIIDEDDKHVSLLFYLSDPEGNLSGYGAWDLFKGYDFNKLNEWAQESILKAAFVEMFSCQGIFEWEGTHVISFDRFSYVVSDVTKYSSYCEKFDDHSLRVNANGLISCKSDVKSNTDNLFVVTIAIVRDDVKVYVM